MTKPVLRSACALVLAGAVLVIGRPVLAQDTAQDNTDRARLDEIARVAAQQFLAARADANQTRSTVPPPPAGTQVDLTLQEATTRALERNLELAVERLNPQTFDLSLARIRAAYRPTVTTAFGQQSRIQAPTSTLNGGFIVDNDTTTYNSGLSQLLPKFGGNVAFQFNNNKQVSNNVNANYNPAFNSSFNFNYTQPLLRGFLIDNN